MIPTNLSDEEQAETLRVRALVQQLNNTTARVVLEGTSYFKFLSGQWGTLEGDRVPSDSTLHAQLEEELEYNQDRSTTVYETDKNTFGDDIIIETGNCDIN